MRIRTQRGLVEGCAKGADIQLNRASTFVREVLARRGRILGPLSMLNAKPFKDDLEVAHILSPLSSSLDICAEAWLRGLEATQAARPSKKLPA